MLKTSSVTLSSANSIIILSSVNRNSAIFCRQQFCYLQWLLIMISDILCREQYFTIFYKQHSAIFYSRLPQIAAQVPHVVALRIILGGTWKVFRNKENNKKYISLWHFGPRHQIFCGTWAKIIEDPYSIGSNSAIFCKQPVDNSAMSSIQQ